MTQRIFRFTAAAALIAALGATPPPPPAPVAAYVDDLFGVAAIEGNNAELDMAQLALQKSRADETRDFAQRMIDEHTALAQRFSRVAPAAAASLPDRENDVDRLALTRLSALPAVSFDQEYLTQQIGDHLATIAVFSAEAEDGHNPDLKSFAQHELPMLRAHLEEALDMARHIGGGGPFKGH
jgi:putative membrane protein